MLIGISGVPVEHTATAPEGFTVRDLKKAIEGTALKTRGSSDWFGGVDVHHVFFEGLHKTTDGAYAIMWGS